MRTMRLAQSASLAQGGDAESDEAVHVGGLFRHHRQTQSHFAATTVAPPSSSCGSAAARSLGISVIGAVTSRERLPPDFAPPISTRPLARADPSRNRPHEFEVIRIAISLVDDGPHIGSKTASNGGLDSVERRLVATSPQIYWPG